MPNKVTVKIYGQEYTITGDKEEDKILQIAEYVNAQIKEIGKLSRSSNNLSLATLLALNVTEQYFDTLEQLEQVKKEKDRLEKDNSNYTDLYEKSRDVADENQKFVDELKERIKDDEEKLHQLKEKCTEYENNLFDLQMENIQLKSQLEKERDN